MLLFRAMGFLEAVAEFLKSIWDADRRVRRGRVVGESEFCREGGRMVAASLIAIFVIAAGIAIWWWVR